MKKVIALITATVLAIAIASPAQAWYRGGWGGGWGYGGWGYGGGGAIAGAAIAGLAVGALAGAAAAGEGYGYGGYGPYGGYGGGLYANPYPMYPTYGYRVPGWVW